MATVWIPSLMRDLTAGRTQVQVSGRTVGEVIDALDRTYPGVKERLCRGGQLDPTVVVSIDDRIALLGLSQGVDEHCEIRFLPAVSGG